MKIPVKRRDPFTGKYNQWVIEMTEEQAREMAEPRQLRRNIQEIFPELSPEKREFLMTGITPGSWDENIKDE